MDTIKSILLLFGGIGGLVSVIVNYDKIIKNVKSFLLLIYDKCYMLYLKIMAIYYIKKYFIFNGEKTKTIDNLKKYNATYRLLYNIKVLSRINGIQQLLCGIDYKTIFKQIIFGKYNNLIKKWYKDLF